MRLATSLVVTYFSPTPRQLPTSLYFLYPHLLAAPRIDQPLGNPSKHLTMSERIVNTRYNLRRTAHVRARSAPSSPEAMAKGKDTPTDASRLYSDVIKAKDSAPSRASDVCPGSRKTSPEYPDGQRSSEAVIAKELATVRNSDTATVKGIPGSALTSVYFTPAPEESETNGDDHGGWTTVAKKSRLGSPARENR